MESDIPLVLGLQKLLVVCWIRISKVSLLVEDAYCKNEFDSFYRLAKMSASIDCRPQPTVLTSLRQKLFAYKMEMGDGCVLIIKLPVFYLFVGPAVHTGDQIVAFTETISEILDKKNCST